MVKTKRNLIVLLAILLMASLLSLVNLSSAGAQNIISPYDSELELTLSMSEGKLCAATTNVSGYSYQYWIKETIIVDNSPNLGNQQSIWIRVEEHDGTNTIMMSVTEANVDKDGKYHVIVKVTSEDILIDYIYGTYSALNISDILINGKSYHNNIIATKDSELTIKIISNEESNITYAIYYGDEEEPIRPANSTGEFVLAVNKAGNHVFRAEISSNGRTISKKFSVYAYEEYVAEERPIITSLTGETDWDNGGLTTFTMEVSYANNQLIPIAKAQQFDFRLTSGSYSPEAQIIPDGESFKVRFVVDYQNQYGIYYTVGTVYRSGISGADDKIIMYYDGYARNTAKLSQSATDKNGSSLAPSYTIAAGQPVTITASGTIAASEKFPGAGTVEYAFYREDASGWVLIRSYSEEGTFTWTPSRAGIYNIQARMRDSKAGSYEKAVSISYTVTDESLSGTLEVNIYDFESKIKVDSIETGRPYKIEAAYSGTEEVLYMFTLYSKNLGTIYLNKYTTSPYFMFVSTRPDNYIITARVISVNNFGYKDLAKSTEVNSYIYENVNIQGNFYDFDMSVGNEASYVIDVSAISGNVVSLQIEDNAPITQGFTAAAGYLTLTKSAFDAMIADSGSGIHTLRIKTDDKKIYKASVTAATYIIGSKAAFDTFFSAYKANSAATSDWYVILSQDFSLENTYYSSDSGFRGVLDGRGHIISDITVSGRGMFYVINGVFKNIAFINMNSTITSGGAGLIAYHINGENALLENVYVQGNINTSDSAASVIPYGYSKAKVNNVIADVTFANQGAGFGAGSSDMSVSNVYIIGNAAYVFKNSGHVYSSINEFTCAVTELPASEGWSDLWKVNQYGLFFNGNLINHSIISVKYAETKALTNENPLVIDFSDIITEDITIAKIGSTDVAGYAVEKSLVLPKTYVNTLTQGMEYIVQVNDSAAKLVFATYAIDSAQDFISFYAAYRSLPTGSATNGSESWYVVLAQDIDFTGVQYNSSGSAFLVGSDKAENNHYFSGVLDGRGHAIKNLKLNRYLFCRTASTTQIKNIAFINLTYTNTTNSAGLIYIGGGGSINNIYISGTFANTSNNCNGIMYEHWADTVAKNIIVNMTHAGTDKAAGISSAFAENTSTHWKNYVIGNFATAYKPGTAKDSDCLFASEQLFFANVNSLPSSDGWNSYWKLDDTGLYFNGLLLFGR